MEQTSGRPFVWHDEEHYRRYRRELMGILAAALICGAVPYALLWKNYNDGMGFTAAVSVLVLVVLLLAFRHRMMSNFATYILWENTLYRLSDANRGITRMALDNDRDYPEFERDFERARVSGGCWEILSTKEVREKRNGYEFVCTVRRGKKKQKVEKTFLLMPGYQEMERLIAELRSRTVDGFTQNTD